MELPSLASTEATHCRCFLETGEGLTTFTQCTQCLNYRTVVRMKLRVRWWSEEKTEGSEAWDRWQIWKHVMSDPQNYFSMLSFLSQCVVSNVFGSNSTCVFLLSTSSDMGIRDSLVAATTQDLDCTKCSMLTPMSKYPIPNKRSLPSPYLPPYVWSLTHSPAYANTTVTNLRHIFFSDVLLTVQLSIIPIINQLNAQNLVL